MSITVESLISCMEWAAQNALDEYALVRDGCRVTVRRELPATQGAAATLDTTAPVTPDGPDAPDDAAETTGLIAIAAPLAGICHLAQDPGSAPFVDVGAQVTKGQTVCVIEAMKVMSAVVADKDGTVTEICVEDGSSVEAGSSLLKVRT